MPKTHRILILGAGFSKAAGLPLGDELWQEVLREARRYYGGGSGIDREVQRYVTYLRRCDGNSIEPEEVNFEDFLAFLDVEHFLSLQGSDTWSDEGNLTQLVVRRLIGKVINTRTPQIGELPQLYLEFAERINTSDVILTFNYDRLVELSLAAIGKPYRCFPNRFASVGRMMSTIDSSREEVVIHKLHGSLDWFDRSEYEMRLEDAREVSIEYEPKHEIFATGSQFTVEPLLEGLQLDDDPMRKLYRVKELDDLYARQLMWTTPFILAPSKGKILYARPLRNLWHGLAKGGGLNLGMAIIGYSLQGYDEYVRQVLYSLTRNYTEFEPTLELDGIRKGPLRIVDFRTTEADRSELRDHYRFVNPERSRFWYDGFNERALDFLFRQDEVLR